jgi:hypothetical protein
VPTVLKRRGIIVLRHIVRLSQIFQIELYESKTAVERFYSKYHTRTEEEMKELQEVYDKEVTEKVNSENSEKVSTAIGMDNMGQYLIQIYLWF